MPNSVRCRTGGKVARTLITVYSIDHWIRNKATTAGCTTRRSGVARDACGFASVLCDGQTEDLGNLPSSTRELCLFFIMISGAKPLCNGSDTYTQDPAFHKNMVFEIMKTK